MRYLLHSDIFYIISLFLTNNKPITRSWSTSVPDASNMEGICVWLARPQKTEMSTFTFGLLDNYRGAAVVLDCFVLRQFMSFLILFSKRVVRAVGGGEGR